jgi:hypothetical protein
VTFEPSAHQFALACNADGTYLEVTSDVVFNEGNIIHSMGRKTQFENTSPGTFAFTLDNRSGKYTPGNTATSLGRSLFEGMGVSWKLDDRLVHGTIRSFQIVFPSEGNADAARLRVTCDDMLGNAARRELRELNLSLFDSARGQLRWPFADAVGSLLAVESTRGGSTTFTAAGDVEFGVTTSHIPGPDAVVRTGSSSGALSLAPRATFPAISFGEETLGYWGVWLEGTDAATAPYIRLLFITPSSLVGTLILTVSGGNLTLTPGLLGTPITGPAYVAGTAYYCSMGMTSVYAAGTWTVTATLNVNGVAYGPSTWGNPGLIDSLPDAARVPLSAHLTSTGGGSTYFSHLSFSLDPLSEWPVQENVADQRLAALTAAVPEVTLDTLPTMATAMLSYPNVEGQATLDAVNDVMRSEQGAIYTVTTGTLTSPVEKIKVRSRDRNAAAAYVFSMNEVNGQDIIRSLNATVSSFTVTGADASVTYADPTLVSVVGAATGSDRLPLRDYIDLYAWVTDRMNRGRNIGIPIVSITIDGRGLATDRWSDLMAIVPGDRLHITDLPATQLGYSTWDGWVLGRSEVHTDERRNNFTFYLQPCLPDTAVFDTHYWMADGALTLSSAIVSAVATTMSVATTGPLLEQVAVPYDLMVDDEQVTVTACSGATPQVATITRGVNGTTATTHTTAAVIEVVNTPYLDVYEALYSDHYGPEADSHDSLFAF